MTRRSDATPRSMTVSSLWRRWWFHLGAVMVVVPLVYLQSYIEFQDMLLRADEQDRRAVDITVGPWSIELQELASEEPYWHPGEGFEKSFRIVPCRACVADIRAIFVNLKRPGSSEYGALAGGNPYRSFAEMKIGRNPSRDDMVWITAEGWDGSLHQAKVPLASASPVTANWIGQRHETTCSSLPVNGEKCPAGQ